MKRQTECFTDKTKLQKASGKPFSF